MSAPQDPASSPGDTQAGAGASHRSVLRLLRLRGFLHLLAVRWPSQVADGMFQLGAAALLLFAVDLREVTSATELVELLAITAVPFIVAGPLAGVLLDRWRRQRILVWSNALRMAVIAAGLAGISRFALGLSWGQTGFYAALLVAIALNRFFLATLGAVLPRVVPGEELVVANAVASTGGSVAALLGVGAGGAIAAAIGDTRGGPEVVVLAALALYGLAALAAAVMPTESLGPDRERPPPPLHTDLRAAVGDLAEGVRLLRTSRRAWAPIAGFSLLRAGQLVASVTALLVLRNVYGGGSGTVALFFTVFGLGVGLGAVAVSLADHLADLPPGAALRAGLAATGLAVLVLGPGRSPTAFTALAGVMGVSFGAAKVATDTLVQGALPDRVRGRTFTAYDVLVNAAVIAAGLVTVAGLPDTSAATPLLLADGALVLVAAATSRTWLGQLPPPVDIATWEQAEQALRD